MAIEFKTSATGTNSGTSITINKPASVADGDVLVANITIQFQLIAPVTPPTDWVLVASEAYDYSYVAQFLYYKVITSAGGEPSSYTWSWSSSAASAGGISRYSGVYNTTPSDVAASENEGLSTTVTGTGITTATNGAMLVWCAASKNNASISHPSGAGFSEAWDIESPSGLVIDHAYAIQASAGPSGDKSGSITSSEAWVCFLWALRPAASGLSVPVAMWNRRMQEMS